MLPQLIELRIRDVLIVQPMIDPKGICPIEAGKQPVSADDLDPGILDPGKDAQRKAIAHEQRNVGTAQRFAAGKARIDVAESPSEITQALIGVMVQPVQISFK